MAVSFKKNIWTQHSLLKMRQYGLSKNKVLGILSRPEREESGIAPGTIAVMKTNKARRRKPPGEIWLMYKDILRRGLLQERKIISCWRYPGVSKPGEEIPIPEEIRRELLKNNDF
ncbi:MAG: hypothetical protein HYT35_01595 [Candidatus Staskawiczbacteria bacterium]|nr:hypothetical protein [Candidatus Staskawiczbacteria bacterium]